MAVACATCAIRLELLKLIEEKNKRIRKQQALIAEYQQLKINFNPN